MSTAVRLRRTLAGELLETSVMGYALSLTWGAKVRPDWFSKVW